MNDYTQDVRIDTIGEFHLHDGLNFRRADDEGTVVLRITESDHEGSPTIREVTIDEMSWASLVASVSQLGETPDSFQAARDLHAGRLAPGRALLGLALEGALWRVKHASA